MVPKFLALALLVLCGCSSESSSAGQPPSSGGVTLPDYFAVINSGDMAEFVALDGSARGPIADSFNFPGFLSRSGHLSGDGSLFIGTFHQPVRAFLFRVGGGGVGLFSHSLADSVSGVHWAPKGDTALLHYSTSQSTFDTYLAKNTSPYSQQINPTDHLFVFEGWSRDGSMLAVRDFDTALNTITLKVLSSTGVPLTDLESGGAYTGQGVTWAQDYMAYPVERDFAGTPYVALNQFTQSTGSSDLLLAPGLAYQGSRYSPDGSWLAVRYQGQPPQFARGVLLFPQANTANPIDFVQSDVDANSVRLMDWSPDGNRIALVYAGAISGTSELSGQRLALCGTDGIQQRILQDPPVGSTIQGLAWSPSGRYLAFNSDHQLGGEQKLYLVDTAGSLLPVLLPAAAVGRATDLLWSGDSEWLYSRHFSGFDEFLVGTQLPDPTGYEVLADNVNGSQSAYPALQGTPGRPGVVFVRRDTATNSDEVIYLEGSNPSGQVTLTQPSQAGQQIRVGQLWVRGPTSGL
ncbi:MAG: PD40 domain-containing protein [Planctomycetes bacterium]|nr:PD40 domain-containing protein [Planctomycetota bacterium]